MSWTGKIQAATAKLAWKLKCLSLSAVIAAAQKWVVFMLPLDLKRLDFILKSWVRPHVVEKSKSCGPSKSFENGFISCFCHLHKMWLHSHYCYVLSFQMLLFWSRGYKRKQYSSYSFSFVTEVASWALSACSEILCSEKYQHLQSILKKNSNQICPGLNQVICFPFSYMLCPNVRKS